MYELIAAIEEATERHVEIDEDLRVDEPEELDVRVC